MEESVMEEAALVALSLASAETAPTDIANDEPPQAEKTDPAPELSKTMDGAGRKTDEIGIPLDSDEDAALKLLSAIKLQENLPATSPSRKSNLRAPSKDEALAPIAKAAGRRRRSCISPLALLAALIVGFGVRAQLHEQRWPDAPPQSNASMKTLVDQIVKSESQGNPAAKNPYSSAVGLGQFVEGTWLDLVKRHRPEIAASLTEKQILELREDPELSRFMTGRYVEQNTSILAKRGLPATPASLYLAHFAGPGGAAAILVAPENADAATVIANADHRPSVTREKIVSGNPFMRNFTAKDLRNWADLKMQSLNFNASAAEEKSASQSN
jgi:hypothetical protein